MNEIPRPGERYRHFKNKYYQIEALATHSETGERMVVYQALYGDFGVWVRPLSMFMEKVDREKYPDADQEYRFQRVTSGAEAPVSDASVSDVSAPEKDAAGSVAEAESGRGRESAGNAMEASEKAASEEAAPMNALLLDFLDTDSIEERLALLQRMKGRVGQRELDSLCFCLDVQPMEGPLEDQLDSLKQYLKMQQRYDASRLRRS